MGKRMEMAAAAIGLGALLLSGCAQGVKGNASGTEGSSFAEPAYEWGNLSGERLVVWGIYPELERSYIQKAFARYEELTGNELEAVQIPKAEFEQKMADSMANRGEGWDILLSYGGTNIENYDPEENFYDFTDAPWVEDLTDTSINQTIYQGRVVGLPHWEASISGTLYNKDIFDKYHLQVPETQQEFMAVCEALKGHGVTPLYLPAKEVSMLLYQFPLDAIVEDESVLDGLNEGRLGYADLTEMERVVEWYRTMAENGYLGDGYQDNDWEGMSEALDSGEYAMMLCWDTWLYTDFKGDPSRFGLMPAFVGVPEEGGFEGPNLGLFIVNQNSARLEASLDFITFLADPYNYNVAFEGIYTAPVFRGQVASISTPQYLESERLIERKYRDSTAWLRIRGFSQMDASCILEYMDAGGAKSAGECLERMDALRDKRLGR